MAGSNFKDPKNNDLASPFPAPSMGSAKDSQEDNFRPTPGVDGQEDGDQSTPEAKRAGYGYSFVRGGVGSPFGGHNMNDRNQYTSKLPRGSSL